MDHDCGCPNNPRAVKKAAQQGKKGYNVYSCKHARVRDDAVQNSMNKRKEAHNVSNKKSK